MNKKEKMISIECLRVLIMFFIVLHHCIVSGLGLNNIMNSGEYCLTSQIALLSLINAFVVIAVNVFFLISGYFGIRFGMKKCLKLLGEISFYSLSIYLITVFLGENGFSIRQIFSK